MDKSTVIHYLKQQEFQMEQQLKALRQTISLIEFNGSTTGNTIPSAPQLEKVNEPVSAPVAAQPEKTDKPSGSRIVNGKKVRPIKMPEAYDSNLSYTRKLAFLLSKNGPQTSQELIKLVQEQEPNEDKTKIERSVTITASSMYRKGLVNATRNGRAYVYSI